MEPQVLSTETDDETAEFTVSLGEDDYRFDVYTEGEKAVVEYQETHTWRGEVRVSQPADDIYKMLMVSDEMTKFLEKYDLKGIRRAVRP